MITQEYIKSILSYNPDTGIFLWLIKLNQYIRIGSTAGSVNKRDGYTRIIINGKSYLAHRISFLYMNGIFPVGQVDHIDGIRANNKWDNLRDADNSQNQQNQKQAKSSNKSGLLGASFNKQCNKYHAQISLNKKIKHLGYFNTAIEAHEAYLTAKRKFHEFNTL